MPLQAASLVEGVTISALAQRILANFILSDIFTVLDVL